jgi:hypothetical protein
MLRRQGDGSGALAAFHESAAITARQAVADPANAQWQRDLAGCRERISDVLRDQRDFAGALDAYSDAATIIGCLTAADPGNTDFQKDLSVRQNRVGNTCAVEGNAVGALAAYRDALAIGFRIATADPTNVQWQDGLFGILWNLASFSLLGGEKDATCDFARHLDTRAKPMATRFPQYGKPQDYLRATPDLLARTGAARPTAETGPTNAVRSLIGCRRHNRNDRSGKTGFMRQLVRGAARKFRLKWSTGNVPTLSRTFHCKPRSGPGGLWCNFPAVLSLPPSGELRAV